MSLHHLLLLYSEPPHSDALLAAARIQALQPASSPLPSVKSDQEKDKRTFEEIFSRIEELERLEGEAERKGASIKAAPASSSMKKGFLLGFKGNSTLAKENKAGKSSPAESQSSNSSPAVHRPTVTLSAPPTEQEKAFLGDVVERSVLKDPETTSIQNLTSASQPPKTSKFKAARKEL